jgi:hypothetical protein
MVGGYKNAEDQYNYLNPAVLQVIFQKIPSRAISFNKALASTP